MVRPCAKYARLNCEHRQKNTDGKTPSDIFYVGLSTCARCGRLSAWLVDGQARSIATASTEKNTNCKNAVGYFYVGLLTYARRGLIWGLVYAVTKYKRAMTARFRNVAKGNISRLRDAQAFHAAVKRPPYFTFARQRRQFTASAACRACSHTRGAVCFWAWVGDEQARSKWLHCFSLCAKKYKLKLLTNFLLFAKFVLSGSGALFDLFSPAHKVRKVGFGASPIKENSATFGSEL